MKEEPICPNNELDRLIGILQDGRAGQHSLQSIAFVLERLRNAQMQGRVLPDPGDPRDWKTASRDRHDAEIAALLARRELVLKRQPG